MANDMGFVIPFKSAVESQNLFVKQDAELTASGKTRNHSKIVICKGSVFGQISICPGTVLIEYCLAVQEFIQRVIPGLCRKLRRITGAVETTGA